jgi:hypothetical protein
LITAIIFCPQYSNAQNNTAATLGIFLKATASLVQIRRADLIKTHEFFFDGN